ncbi:MAG: nucleoside-diphosphate kinase [Actinobacteria bacterium]|nr:nucleoside-diphosphate kinase [Actinomycetota bacterium]
MDRTLVICKPDAVERGLVGEIVARFERRNLKIVAAELRQVDGATAARHYAEHEGKPFYGELIEFITRSPAMVMVVEGPEETWKVVRLMMGVTNPRDAAPGTIRGDLGILFTENLVHGSDSLESAEREIDIWFPGTLVKD